MLLAGLGLTLATLHTAPPAELPRAPLPPGPEPCAWAVWQDKQDDPDPWATEFKNIQKQVYGMQKEYNTKRCEFEMKQRELTALEDKWEDLKKEAIKPNSEEVAPADILPSPCYGSSHCAACDPAVHP